MHKKLRYVINSNSYLVACSKRACQDWIPNGKGGGYLSIRRKCFFQNLFTRSLSKEIGNVLMDALPQETWIELKPQRRSLVVVDGRLGVRTPSRSFSLGGNKDTGHCVQDGVVEVVMEGDGENVQELCRSHVAAGARLAIGCEITRPFGVILSAYRRGSRLKQLEGAVKITEYNVIPIEEGIVLDGRQNNDGDLTFPTSVLATEAQDCYEAFESDQVVLPHAQFRRALQSTIRACYYDGRLDAE